MRPGQNRATQKTGQETAALLGLVLLAAIPYLNSLTNSFVYDDSQQVLDNPYAHSFRYLGKIFGSTVWTFQGAQGVTNYYRPLMTFAYLIGYKWFGPIPFGFHEASLVLHIGVVLLVFALTDRLFGDRLLSLVAAGLFALHPIHTESVAWIAGVTDLELSFFFLLTFLLYLRLDRTETGRSASWFLRAAILAAYALALLSKEQALMFPALAAIFEHFYRGDRHSTTLGTKLWRYTPLWLMAACYAAFRVFVLGGFAPAVARPALRWTAVVLSAIALVGTYLWKLLWPVHLAAFYVFHESRSLADPRVLDGLAGLAACLILFGWLWKRAHALSFSFVWMGIALAPVLNARWMPAQVFAERYLYLPSVGFCWLVGAAAVKAWRAAPLDYSSPHIPFLRRAVPAVLVMVGVLYGIRTVQRNRDWRTEETLYRKTLEEAPDAQLIRTNLGVVYWEHGDQGAAEREWLQALGPNTPYVPTLNNLGMLRTHQKRYEEATAFLQQAIHDRPKFMDPHKNLALLYAETDRTADADREFQLAVSLAPLSTVARNAYGQFLLDQKHLAEAQQQFTLSNEADPNVEAEEHLGDVFELENDPVRARAAFEAALTHNADDSHALFAIGRLDERAGRLNEAIREYRAGLNTDPANADALAALRRLASAREAR